MDNCLPTLRLYILLSIIFVFHNIHKSFEMESLDVSITYRVDNDLLSYYG